MSEVHCKRAIAAQTLGAGVIHLDEAAFMQRPRHMLEADVVLHKVDGDIDLLKMVKARPISCLKGKTLPGDHPEAACAAHANAALTSGRRLSCTRWPGWHSLRCEAHT